MLVDSHCHLDRVDLTPYDHQFGAMLDATREQGVAHLLCVCIDLVQYPAMRDLVAEYPQISHSVGVHPSEDPNAEGHIEPSVEQLIGLATQPGVVAIGETGLDYHYNQGDLRWQQARFRVHIEAAKQSQRPLIIHTRDAREDTIAILRETGAEQAGGVLHCFTETWEMAEQALDLGFYISFSGILTFKNAESLREVARKVPLDRLLIETDAPYLAPVPYRGKKNEPRYVSRVADQVAELRGLSRAEVDDITTENFFRLFPLAQRPEAA